MVLSDAGKGILLCLLMSFYQQAQANETPNNTCGFSEAAWALASLIIEDEAQQRAQIHCHPSLAQAAEDEARIMADYGMVRHNLG